MLYPVIPVYLQQIGFSVFWIGLLEGIANFTAGVSKGYFGKWSDSTGLRLPFVKIGYLLSAFSKPMLGILTLKWWVFLSRTTDRLGKGIRTAARDALLSQEATPATKARVFGFHRSMDTAIGFYTSCQSICAPGASTIAGLLWSSYGSQLTFMLTAGVAVLVSFCFLSKR